MVTQWQSDELIVGRLRVTSARIDPAIAQLRLSLLLNNAASHPTSLPPTAIVFIRKLSDPLPRSLKLQHNHIRPPAAWREALNTKLENMIANAARPALGAVPANAQAVVFLDRSELLAALADDWCEGRLATHWWWQSLLRRMTASQLVKEFWQNAPQYVPAALDKLATVAKAARFVQTFSDSEALALLISVARTFALNDLVAVLEKLPVGQKVSTLSHEAFVSPSLAKERNDERPVIETHSNAPWDDWIQTNQTRDLGPEQQTLLGVAVMLQRAPAKVRTKSFALAVETWSYEITAVSATLFLQYEEKKTIEGVSRAQTIHGSSTGRSDSNSSTQIKSEASSFEESLCGTAPTSMDSNLTLPQKTTASLGSDQLNQPQPPPATAPQVEAPVFGSDDTNSNFASSQISTDPPAVELYDSPAIELQIETDFGGVFYLINLGIYLDLYGDFTTPAEPGINLNIWDFVALVGRELVGKRIEDDPIWTLLQRLSGRTEGEDPGTPQVREWLAELMPHIRARLRSALGLTRTEDPGPIVCEQRARVTLTPTHIDVFFALAGLPIELRIAGLDRDPSWVPAAGRFINFHFE